MITLHLGAGAVNSHRFRFCRTAQAARVEAGREGLCPAALARSRPGGDAFLNSEEIGAHSALQHPADSEKTPSKRRGRRIRAGL